MTEPSVRLARLAWRDPVAAMAPFANEPFAVLMLSAGGPPARWSYLARSPSRVRTIGGVDTDQDFSALRTLLGPHRTRQDEGPPFQGGVIGLIAYEFADRLEPLGLERDRDWPDMVLARFDSLLAFDHREQVVWSVRGGTADPAAWLEARLAPGGETSAPPAATFVAEACAMAYEDAVTATTARILAGEIFQANIARGWRGWLAEGAQPYGAFHRLVEQSPAPFCAYWRLPGAALVSHSPERFVAIAADGATVLAAPIKGTRPRSADPCQDLRNAAELLASAKDRAENLMIVDLMRNDLSRVCQPGSVRAPGLCGLESFPTVHHLVSHVTGRLEAGLDVADLLGAVFPPGSITGAPKVQAMKVIAAQEPPRGPWCGALFWAGCDGAFESSVLIRTAAFVEDGRGWRFRAPAGAGIVADSDPVSERLETEVKISGLARALMGRV